jgi:hypothetical protein
MFKKRESDRTVNCRNVNLGICFVLALIFGSQKHRECEGKRQSNM